MTIKILWGIIIGWLRYGLPVNFQAAVVEPSKGSQKKLRAELHKLYIHLDGSAAGPIDVSFVLKRSDELNAAAERGLKKTLI